MKTLKQIIIAAIIISTPNLSISQTIDSIAIVDEGSDYSMYYSGYRLMGGYNHNVKQFFQSDTLMVFSKYVLLSSFGDSERYDTTFTLNSAFNPDIHNLHLKTFDSAWIYDNGTVDTITVAVDSAFIPAKQLSQAERKLFSGEIKLYPNPVSNILHLEVSGLKVLSRIEITDLSGKVIRSYAKDKRKLDVRDCKRGVYLLTFNTERGLRQRKIWME